MIATANETIKPGYVRVMQGIYRRGKADGAKHYQKTPPQNTYKMTNFRKMWQQGFDDGTVEAVRKALTELESHEPA